MVSAKFSKLFHRHQPVSLSEKQEIFINPAQLQDPHQTSDTKSSDQNHSSSSPSKASYPSSPTSEAPLPPNSRAASAGDVCLYPDLVASPEPEQEILQSSDHTAPDRSTPADQKDLHHPSPVACLDSLDPRSQLSEQLIDTESLLQDQIELKAQDLKNLEGMNKHSLGRNPLQILSSRIKSSRSKTSSDRQSVRSLSHSPSFTSLIDRSKNSSHDRSPPVSDSTNQSGTFQLKSFRNVRVPSVPEKSAPHVSRSGSLPQASQGRPASVASNSPSLIYSLSRPVSPSPRISAAAFREAQAARRSRTSFSSTHSDQLSSDGVISSSQNFSAACRTFDSQSISRPSGSKKAASDIGHSTPRLKGSSKSQKGVAIVSSRRNVTAPLINQIPGRSQPKPPNQSSLITPFEAFDHNLLNEHDILVPPRPAFYGSRSAVRSCSSDQRQSAILDSRNRTATSHNGGNYSDLYSQQLGNGSRLSVRSLPASSATASQSRQRSRNRAGTSNSKAAQAQLDQWHSDEEDENGVKLSSKLYNNKATSPPPLPPLTYQQAKIIKTGEQEETEDDEIPLSVLKKRSVTSIRDAAAAQTLIKGRQQLQQSCDPVRSPIKNPLSNLAAELPLFAPLATVNQPYTARDSTFGAGSGSGPQPSLNPVAGPLSNTQLSSESLSRVLAPHPSIGLTIQREGLLGPLPSNFNPRGNSPVSSSSGGSGSGSWSLPITPRDSTGATTSHSSILTAGNSSGNTKNRVAFDPSLLDKESTGRITKVKPAQRLGHLSSESIDSQRSRVSRNFKAQGRDSLVEEQRPGDNFLRSSFIGYGGEMGVRVEDLGVPAGVDPFLYSGLTAEQKIQLHHRSQMMMQMMAAQAQQMHALAALSQQSGLMMGYNMSPMGWPNQMGGMVGNMMAGGSQVGIESTLPSSSSSLSLRNRVNNQNSNHTHHHSLSQSLFYGGGSRGKELE
ncbi:hypothetical protein BY996DRAFT_6419980 [Phakopsora pachyrhizi]|nr:hypothetical protein BY996DRAFT_6419980 [Phakopsora pachyrhizi]